MFFQFGDILFYYKIEQSIFPNLFPPHPPFSEFSESLRDMVFFYSAPELFAQKLSKKFFISSDLGANS